MAINCIIIDDEQPARQLLENYCCKIEDIKVLGSFKSPIAALTLLNKNIVDLIFLDIQMPELTGIDFLKSIKTFSAKIIFTTAYREYALEGFELNVVDYLLKPIEFHRFLQAIEKVKQLHASFSLSKPMETKSETLIIKADRKQYRLTFQNIYYIKSENEYVSYVTQSYGNLLVHDALKNVEKYFSEHSNFIRIHRSFIVNILHITFVEGNRVFINNEYLSISETYKIAFFKLWNSL